MASWGIDAIATAVGMTKQELLDGSMMADLTDDLVDPAAVARYDIPQVDAWDHAPADGALPSAPSGHLLQRHDRLSEGVSVVGGGYAYWYIDGGNVGYSIEGQSPDLGPDHSVTLTRLR